MLTDDPDFNKYQEIAIPSPAPKSSSKKLQTMGIGNQIDEQAPESEEQTSEEITATEPIQGHDTHGSVPDKNKERLEEYLLGLLEKTSTGFTVVLIMHVIAFAIGIGLIITAIVLAAQNGDGSNNLVTVFLGTAGTADIVFLMYRPAKEIQRSRANASKLSASVSEWFSISRGLDVAYKKLLTQGSIKDNFSEIKQIVELRRDTTIKLVETMDKFVASRSLKQKDSDEA